MEWRTLLRRMTPLMAVALVLGAAGTALAQRDPTLPVEPAPGIPVEPREVCVPVGLALTAVTQRAVLAEALPPQANRTTVPGGNAADEVRIVVPGPVRVGACAEYEGFWGNLAFGTAGAQLHVYRAPAADAAAVEPVARDAVKHMLRGPARQRAQLRAMTGLSEPGVYAFVAVLRAHAEKPVTTAAPGQSDEDSLRLRFVVEVRPRPQPTPGGRITGVVLSAEGGPLAGAVVMARPAQSAEPVRPLSLAAWPEHLLGSGGVLTANALAARPAALLQERGGPAARTDEHGRYALQVPAGRYLVVAEAAGYRAQWFNGQAQPRDAEVVEVPAGAERGGVDFRLEKVAQRPPEEPPQRGKILGTVNGPDGPLAGAVVMARPARDNAARGGPAARTGADGGYELVLPPGEYLVVAEAQAFQPQWYKEADKPEDATAVEVKADAAAQGVDFLLRPREPRPPVEPPQRGKIRGVVMGPDGPLAGAAVMARPAPQRSEPGIPLVSDAVAQEGLMARAVTARDGTYVLILAPGEYLVVAEAQAFQPQWYKEADKPEDATPVEVKADATVEGVDFRLRPREPRPPVERPTALVAGSVLRAGVPVPGTRVFAIPVELLVDDPNVPAPRLPFPSGGPAAATRADGTFEMRVPPGEYVFAALLVGSRTGDLVQFFDRKSVLADADRVLLVADEERRDIHFHFD